MRPIAILIVASLLCLLPTATALPVDLISDGGEGGPCGDDPCFQTFPLTQDPLPMGADVTKVSAGGDCHEGSYAVACETEECLGSVWVFAECRGTTTCYAFARTTCVAGLNQGKAIAWANVLIERRGLGSETVPDAHVTTPGVGVGGDCDDHDVAVSCNYHVREADLCLRLPGDPTDPAELEPCGVSSLHCHAYALGSCQHGLALSNYEPMCRLALSVCTPVCVTLADLSVTFCHTGE